MLSYNETTRYVSAAPPTSLHQAAVATATASMGKAHSIPQHDAKRNARHIWIITGPAGCGKSSVAGFLAQHLNLPYIEGDDFHPLSNVQKMSSGIPLTDDDRWSWLETLRNQAILQLQLGAGGCVVTCSCLKRRYRDVIRSAAADGDGDVVVRFVYLRASEELLVKRVRARERDGHYMKGDMVHSQFTALEEPGEGEVDVVEVDVSGSLQHVQQVALERVRECMQDVWSFPLS